MDKSKQIAILELTKMAALTMNHNRSILISKSILLQNGIINFLKILNLLNQKKEEAISMKMSLPELVHI